MFDKSETTAISKTLTDLKRDVTNVTDQKKLVEILNHFSAGITDEVFLVQNEEHLNDKGVMVSLEYFAELLSYQEAIQDVFGYLVEEEAIAQKNK